jgi:1,2-diacylglycerol 3-beta-galactosyltransferase
MDVHSNLICGRRLKRRIASYAPDVIVSVHPAMNYVPLRQVKILSKTLGKHIPFFTVVTDLASGHATWFQKNVDKLYLASARLKQKAQRRGGTPEENIVMTGLPIRHDFAVEAEKLGDRTTAEGKEYQEAVRAELGLDPKKPMVMLMGGGEGVGSLAKIVDELYVSFSKQGVDATICVICGRNEKLKKSLEQRDWNSVLAGEHKPKRRVALLQFLRHPRSSRMQKTFDRALAQPEGEEPVGKAKVDVVGLGFVTRMAEYMVAADVLVSKAGPGTIAEAAAVGLPVMLTSFLPGQEAGNVDYVLDNDFGDYNKDPVVIAEEVACWLKDNDLMDSMSRKARAVGVPHAAADIVKNIGSITQTWKALNGDDVIHNAVAPS